MQIILAKCKFHLPEIELEKLMYHFPLYVLRVELEKLMYHLSEITLAQYKYHLPEIEPEKLMYILKVLYTSLEIVIEVNYGC